MAANNPFTSFTITQPFLGASLQFQPALGSQELENLIDLYVPGTTSKQDKLSSVTIDFYLNATVDVNSGALTKTYNVFSSPWQSFEQSPTQSQSSGFSPAIYTPSPGSSATFGQDSGYASLTMTPPTRGKPSRVTKKTKKEVKKKVDEARLPGFSIMTKDGIDVTSTAGRGTKTKEQREHAHLMRIMKACDDCKRKKVRCDPSHKRADNEMSRSSSSTTSSRPEPRPTSSQPSISRETTHSSTPAFSPSNGIDDFVLFPEGFDTWNAADLSLEYQDISEFNFDINDMEVTDFSPMSLNPQSLDYSFYQQPSSSFGQSSQASYTPQSSASFDVDQWTESLGVPPSSHSPRSSSQGDTQGGRQLELQSPSQFSPSHVQTQPAANDGVAAMPDIYGSAPSHLSTTIAGTSTAESATSSWSPLHSSTGSNSSNQDDLLPVTVGGYFELPDVSLSSLSSVRLRSSGSQARASRLQATASSGGYQPLVTRGSGQDDTDMQLVQQHTDLSRASDQSNFVASSFFNSTSQSLSSSGSGILVDSSDPWDGSTEQGANVQARSSALTPTMRSPQSIETVATNHEGVVYHQAIRPDYQDFILYSPLLRSSLDSSTSSFRPSASATAHAELEMLYNQHWTLASSQPHEQTSTPANFSQTIESQDSASGSFIEETTQTQDMIMSDADSDYDFAVSLSQSQSQQQSSPFYLSFTLLTLGLATFLALPNIQQLQTLSQQWITTTNPLLATATLLFCATFVAYLPSLSTILDSLPSASENGIPIAALALLSWLTGTSQDQASCGNCGGRRSRSGNRSDGLMNTNIWSGSGAGIASGFLDLVREISPAGLMGLV